MRIHIKNYQRLEDLELNLLPGINLISGSSNNGKSSTIRAVRDFIFNKISKDKIRHGETEVSVELDNAKAIRNSKGVIYEINGDTFEKVGRNILPEIKDKFNIDEMVINGVAIKPNFWFQMDKPFLMDKTQGQKYDLLIGTKNDKYIKALKNIKSEQLELSKVTKKSLEEVIDTLKKNNIKKEKRIQSLNGIEELVNKINEYEKKELEFNNIYNTYMKLKNNNDISKKSKEKIVLLNSIDVKDVYRLQDEYSSLKENMNDMYSKYQQYNSYLSTKDYLEKKINKLVVMFENTDLVNDLSSKLSTKNMEYIELDNCFNNHEQAVINEVRQERLFNEKLEELYKVTKEFEDFKKELGICPLCGGKL